MPARWSSAAVAERGKLGSIAGGGVKTAWASFQALGHACSCMVCASKAEVDGDADVQEDGEAASARDGARLGRRCARGSSGRPPRARAQTSFARRPRACVPRSSATSAVGAGKLRPAGASALRGSSALAAMGARGGQLRPGRRRCRQRQARLGRRYARGSSGRPPRARAQASSARRRARVRHARAHRARCQVDARLTRTSEGAL